MVKFQLFAVAINVCKIYMNSLFVRYNASSEGNVMSITVKALCSPIRLYFFSPLIYAFYYCWHRHRRCGKTYIFQKKKKKIEQKATFTFENIKLHFCWNAHSPLTCVCMPKCTIRKSSRKKMCTPYHERTNEVDFFSSLFPFIFIWLWLLLFDITFPIRCSAFFVCPASDNKLS